MIFFILNLILLAILNFCQLSLNSKKEIIIIKKNLILILIKKKKINDNLKRLYISSNKIKNGYFYREKNDWRIVNLKIHQNKFSIIEFKYKNISIGYIIFKKKCIYEYGCDKKFLKLFIQAIKTF